MAPVCKQRRCPIKPPYAKPSCKSSKPATISLNETQVEDALSGVVLEKGLETRLSRVAQSTFNTKRNNAPFRHLLLYGEKSGVSTRFLRCPRCETTIALGILSLKLRVARYRLGLRFECPMLWPGSRGSAGCLPRISSLDACSGRRFQHPRAEQRNTRFGRLTSIEVAVASCVRSPPRRLLRLRLGALIRFGLGAANCCCCCCSDCRARLLPRMRFSVRVQVSLSLPQLRLSGVSGAPLPCVCNFALQLWLGGFLKCSLKTGRRCIEQPMWARFCNGAAFAPK